MARISTLTMNPTIDVSYEVDRVFHTRKMRTRAEAYAPGGGGINVARVAARLGDDVHCIYAAGGATGPAFDGLVDEHDLPRTRIAIAEPTRVATAVLERESGKEYRYTPTGPALSEPEWRACLDAVNGTSCDCFVASGSLPPGVPDDLMARIARIMQARGMPLAFDSSGAALREGLAGGGILLVKPSLGELRQLCGRELSTYAEIAAAAAGIVASGQAKMVAVTMGHEGAILACGEATGFVPSPPVKAASAVGAGDSFLAAMVHALMQGITPFEALRHGVAAGAAAVLTPGTGLAWPDDINRLLAQVPPVTAVPAGTAR